MKLQNCPMCGGSDIKQPKDDKDDVWCLNKNCRIYDMSFYPDIWNMMRFDKGGKE